MCDPVSIGVTTAALAVGTQVAGAVGQNKAAGANQTAANLTFANQQDTLRQQAVQIDQESSQKSFDTAITAIQSEGSIAASAGEQGLAPTSITQALNASMFGIGRQATADNVNADNERRQLTNQARGNDINRVSQISKVRKASTVGLLLGVGNGIMSGVNAGMSASAAGKR
jgi:hypothetical protein